MFRQTTALIGFILLFLSTSGVAATTPLTASEKAALQAGMQQHIDRQLVDGAYLELNPLSGETRSLHPVTAHPMILRMGSYFVLCSDFRDAEGKPVNVDFFMAQRGKSYVVFHTSIAQRAQLENLMKAGKVQMAD
jgi:hypothetical protein